MVISWDEVILSPFTSGSNLRWNTVVRLMPLLKDPAPRAAFRAAAAAHQTRPSGLTATTEIAITIR